MKQETKKSKLSLIVLISTLALIIVSIGYAAFINVGDTSGSNVIIPGNLTVGGKILNGNSSSLSMVICKVDLDGRGDFTTIQECVDFAATNSLDGTIKIKTGSTDHLIAVPIIMPPLRTLILEGEGWGTIIMPSVPMATMINATNSTFLQINNIKLDGDGLITQSCVNFDQTTQRFTGNAMQNSLLIRCGNRAISMQSTDGFYCFNTWTETSDMGIYGGGSGLFTFVDCKLNGDEGLVTVGNGGIWQIIGGSANTIVLGGTHKLWATNLYMEDNVSTFFNGTSANAKLYIIQGFMKQDGETPVISGTFNSVSLENSFLQNNGVVATVNFTGQLNLLGKNDLGNGIDDTNIIYTPQTTGNLTVVGQAAINGNLFMDTVLDPHIFLDSDKFIYLNDTGGDYIAVHLNTAQGDESFAIEDENYVRKFQFNVEPGAPTFLNSGNVIVGGIDTDNKFAVVGDANITTDLLVGRDMTVVKNLTVEENLTVLGELISDTIHDTTSEGLVFAVSFNNGSVDADTALDSSTNNIHGTVTNAVHNITGGLNNGGSYFFDGVDDRIAFINSSAANIVDENITISLWASIASYPGTFVTFVDRGDPGALGYLFRMRNSPQLEFRFNSITTSCSFTPIIDQLYNFVVTYDGSNVNFFVDKVLICSPARSDKINSTNAIMYIGTRTASLDDFHGTIDNVEIYNRVLSDAEISQKYLKRKEVSNSYLSQKNIIISALGETTINSISGDGNGKAVCIKADGSLGTCTDAVGVGGTCTCA